MTKRQQTALQRRKDAELGRLIRRTAQVIEQEGLPAMVTVRNGEVAVAHLDEMSFEQLLKLKLAMNPFVD